MRLFYRYYLWESTLELEIRTIKKAFYLNPGDEIFIDGIPYNITGKKELNQETKEIYIYVKEKFRFKRSC